MPSKQNVAIILATMWLVFTGTLIVWWMYFAMGLIDSFDLAKGHENSMYRTMLVWEGATLLILLLAGGGALIYFIVRENRRVKEMNAFFSGFTHDLKTSLTGVRILTESLKDDLKSMPKESGGLLNLSDRLLTDVSRLQIQVENSLFVGGAASAALYFEELSFGEILEIMKESWPQLDVQYGLRGASGSVGQPGDDGENIGRTCSDQIYVHADRRALENVINNIFHNAIIHGQAKKMNVQVVKQSSGVVHISFCDDGKGFSGNVNSLGKMFYRHNPSSGSGLGLYTAQSYVRKMNGKITFDVGGGRFRVQLELPGHVKIGPPGVSYE